MTAALLYGVYYAALLAPGVPLGRAVMGRRHPAAWIAGGVVGYGLTTVALWAAIALGTTSRLAFVLAWSCAMLAGLAAARVARRGLSIFVWERADTFAFTALLALTLLVTVPPFARVGQREADGTRLYRAYFTADFVWHMALTAELTKFDMPPRNPYLASQPIHYYWSYFVPPAVAAARGPAPLRSVEDCLRANAIYSALLFTSLMFVLARAAVSRGWAAALGVGIAVTASSAEGLYAVWRLKSDGVPLSFLRELNIDAMSNWYLHGLRVDGLQRCFWYVPQHSMSYSAGIAGLVVAATAGAAAPIGAVLLAGLALATSAMANPFVGAVFSAAYGLAVVLDALRSRQPALLARHAIAAVAVAGAAGWCAANAMVGGAGQSLLFGLNGLARHRPVAALLLSLGPILVPVLAGSFPKLLASRAALCAFITIALALLLMHVVSLNVDEAWVGFRAGQILLAVAPVLVARAALGLWSPGRPRAATAALFVLVLAVGMPMTAIDWYNARDTSNRGRSVGGFAWTIGITPSEQEAFRWLQRATASGAIVQMDAEARGRETWSLIPSFGERRMAAGQPISLLHVPEYDSGSQQVRQMYATGDAATAREIARSLGIQYVYTDRVERAAYPEGVAKFDAHPESFVPVFRNDEVRIYAVQ